VFGEALVWKRTEAPWEEEEEKMKKEEEKKEEEVAKLI
jgi:hypothetical protein